MPRKLNRQNVSPASILGASAPERTGIVHLGIGNFHRAHAAVYTAKALAVAPGDWGIVAVANRNRTVVDPLVEQDYLYSVLEMSSEGERVDVMDVHRAAFVAAEQTTEVMDQIADPAHKIITMTISEAGYHTNAGTGRLDVDGDAIRYDVAHPEAPRTMIGIVGQGLLRRYRAGGAPVAVLSCDNMQSAGHTTRARVVEYLEAVNPGAAAMEWLQNQVGFPNAMVDRIVPGTDARTRADVERLLGLSDAIPVPAERFSMWVLEDTFPAGRPAWHQVGATFSDEVEKYELVKLRLLNGCHSLIAYLGVLAGEDTIPDSRRHDYIANCAMAAMRNEYLPSIDLPTGFDVESYIGQLFDRWNNTTLGDKSWRVGTDGSTKLPQRIPEPAVEALDKGYLPQQMALTAASWIAAVCPPPGFEPGEVAAKIIEPQRANLAKVTAGATDARSHTLAVMRGGFLPERLTGRDEFNQRVADFVEIIAKDGVQAACQEALAAGAPANAAPAV